MPAHLPTGDLGIAQKPAGFGQLVEGFGDNLGVIQQAPLFAVDVAGGEGFLPVERAGRDASGQFAGCLALQGLAKGEDSAGVGFEITTPTLRAARWRNCLPASTATSTRCFRFARPHSRFLAVQSRWIGRTLTQ